MSAYDAFSDIAPYYDRIMDHVNYDRWFNVATALAELLPSGFLHVDAACGTGKLVKRLRAAGWNSLGADLSSAMIRTGAKDPGGLPATAADLRALPFQGAIDYATCLFDSINFLLTPDDLSRAFREVHGALRPPGIFYFDVVTERMVTEHFEGQQWTEYHDQFATTWRSSYSRKTCIADTHVRVNVGAAGAIQERIFTQDEIAAALRDAGFSTLGVFDAHSWKATNRRTVRIDYVAVKSNPRSIQRPFQAIANGIRKRLSHDR